MASRRARDGYQVWTRRVRFRWRLSSGQSQRPRSIRDGNLGPQFLALPRDRPDGPIVNLSYWVFPAFRDLKHVAPAVDWEQIIASGLSSIAAARFGGDKMPTD